MRSSSWLLPPLPFSEAGNRRFRLLDDEDLEEDDEGSEPGAVAYFTLTEPSPAEPSGCKWLLPW